MLRAPEDGARVTAATEFAWASPRGTAPVTWVYFGPKDQSRAGEPQVWVATAETETTMPDLSALGVKPTNGARGIWYVVEARGATSVEDAAARGHFADLEGAGGSTRARTLAW
jgi:hypothetical protein